MSQPAYCLGISAFHHDSAACLVRDGAIVAAAQEERSSRKRHDHRFPRQAVNYCLKEAGITPDALTLVAFYDKPWQRLERLLETSVAFAPAGLRSFLTAMPLWLKEQLWLGGLVAGEIGCERPLLYPDHHQSHAASAFYPSPFERAAILTLDGVGEWATTSWGTGHGNRIDLKADLRFPHSLGLLYSAFTDYTGFKVNSGEDKVMGLAPYGEPTYVQQILDELIDLREDGSFRLNMKYFNYCAGRTMTSPAFHRLFGGPPREPERPLTQRDMDLARSVQDVTEEAMLRMARHVRRETGERHLCLAGSVALNGVANGKILREGIFDDIWTQPAAGDAGGALGAALFAWHHVLGGSRTVTPGRDSQAGSCLGPAYVTDETAAWLDAEHYPYERHDDEQLTATVAGYLDEGRVVGWMSGRMEFGLHALGGRSIIGDARNPAMPSVMNLKITRRESFHPFGASVLEEDVSEYFELDRSSPYMLVVAPVRAERRVAVTPEQERLWGIEKLNVRRSDIPAVTHVDYSARVQTVHARDHPAYHRMIQAFKQRTGCAVIINTSFNVRGEPIVCTPRDAYRCFMRTGIDVLVLDNLVLQKAEQPPLKLDDDARAQPAARGWMKIAGAMGTVMTFVVLVLVFLLVLTPVGVARRLFGVDTLGLRYDRARKTYWMPVDPRDPASRPDKPY